MSTFNTRKDRQQDGKAKPHFLVKYRTRKGIKYIHHVDRRGNRAPHCNYSKNPAYWNNIYTTRRRRADDREQAQRIMLGWDAEGITWLVDKRPTEYWW
ncbi:hypothetical protein EF72_21445 [Salmonella enterica]|nr:hypothetical protein [Salmonella enterica]